MGGQDLPAGLPESPAHARGRRPAFYDEAGYTPRFTHIADVDGDGLLDIVTVLWRGGGVTVLRNLGGGRFGRPELYEAGPGPATVDSGDLDGDGHLDLVVGGLDTTALTLLFNNGRGGFEEPEYVVAVGSRDPAMVRVADIDRDGDLDVLASGWPLYAYYNLGGRRFSEPLRFGVPGIFPVLGDFDGDGFVDVALTSRDRDWSAVSVLRNRGGTFRAARTYPLMFQSYVYDALSLSAGDLDGDGDLDLAVVNFNSRGSGHPDAIAFLKNNGAGEFSGLEHLVMRGNDGEWRLLHLQPLDADGDGDLDLLAGGGDDRGRTGFSIVENLGGEFKETRYVPGPGGAFTLADLDGDGRLDFVIGEAVFWNEGDFELTEQVLVAPAARWMTPYTRKALGDFDGDGRVDIAAFGSGRPLRIFRNAGSRRFELVDEHEFRMGSTSMASGDFDGDGAPDLAVALTVRLAAEPTGNGSQRAAVALLRNDGRGRFDEVDRQWLDETYPGLFARDLDGDGDDDLVVSGRGSGTQAEIKLLLSGGGGFEETRTYPLDMMETVAIAEDLNGDGRLDLAVAAGSQISVLLNEAPQRGPDSGVRGCGDTFFRRGDFIDGLHPALSDALLILQYLFTGAGEPGCLKAADVDDDGRVNITDAIVLLKYHFGAERVPEPPFPWCGSDPTEDALSCKEAVGCR